jgi:hypothetical protein
MQQQMYSHTAKYFRYAIKEFLPVLEELKKESRNSYDQEQLSDLIKMYNSVGKEIDAYNLNLDDPNRWYNGEPNEVNLKISEKVLEYFARLALKLAQKWRIEIDKLGKKDYLDETDEKRFYELKKLTWPLEAIIQDDKGIISQYKELGPIEFPGENAVIDIYQGQINEGQNLIKACYVNEARIKEFENLVSKTFDLKRLITMLKELNSAFENKNYISVIALVRSVMNHIPPVFGFSTFDEVKSRYGNASWKKNT